jgi:hypothetical protein
LSVDLGRLCKFDSVEDPPKIFPAFDEDDHRLRVSGLN